MEVPGITSRNVTLPVDAGRGYGRDDEVEVRYLVGGGGPPVVLLHGIGLDAATVSWRHALPALAEDYRVYAPDFPGHGQSEKPSVRYTTSYFRDVLRAFLAELDVARPRLVGISMGGAVALGHALDSGNSRADGGSRDDGNGRDAPEDGVEQLVLIDSYGLGEDAPWRAGASALLRTPFAHRLWWSGMGTTRDAVRGHLRNVVAERPPEDLVEDVYRAVQDDAVGRTVSSWQRSEFRPGGFETCYSDRLSALDVPTLLVHGGADPLLPAEWSKRAVEQVADGRLQVFDQCGHWPPRERPEEFLRVLDWFLDGG